MKKTINGTEYKVWKLPHPLLIHWVLNPGLAINELILGQRLPKESLIKDGLEPLNERSYIHCPSCETVHHGMLWAKSRGFGHYNGIYCPTCEAKIPQILNLFSILILIITFPLWKPLQLLYGDKVKARSLAKLRMNKADIDAEASKPTNYVMMGVFFGVVMGAYFMVTEGLRNGFTSKAFTVGIVSGAVSGLVFAFIMWLVMRGKNTKL